MQSTSTVQRYRKAGDGTNAVTINVNSTINAGKVTVNGATGTVNN